MLTAGNIAAAEAVGGSDRDAVPLNAERRTYESKCVPTERHRILPFDKWKNHSPPSLFELCLTTVAQNIVPTICDEHPAASGATAPVLELKPGIHLDAPITDALLHYYTDNCLETGSQRNMACAVVNMLINAHNRVCPSFANLKQISECNSNLVNKLMAHAPALKALSISARRLKVKEFVDAFETSAARLQILSFTNLTGKMSTCINPKNHFKMFKSSRPNVLANSGRASCKSCERRGRQSLLSRSKTDSVCSLTIESLRSNNDCSAIEGGRFHKQVQKDVPLVVRSFWKLRHLRISSVRSLEGVPFNRFGSTLLQLDLQDCRLNESNFQTISDLTQLRVLDVSQSNNMLMVDSRCLKLLNDKLTNLTELDISGTSLCDPIHTNICLNQSEDIESSIDGLRSRKQKLDFLGLYGCRGKPCALPHLPAKVVAGSSSVAQTLTSLSRYARRERYVERILSDFVSHEHSILETKLQRDACSKLLFLKGVLDAMSVHIASVSVQVNGSMALRKLIAGSHGKLAVSERRQVLRTIITALNKHVKNQTLLSIDLWLLIKFEIPQDVLFIYDELAVLLLRILRNKVLQGKILCNTLYLLRHLAQVVDRKHDVLSKLDVVAAVINVITKRFLRRSALLHDIEEDALTRAWAVLCTMTDEMPESCEQFTLHGGASTFLKCYASFQYNDELIGIMTATMSNVAEIRKLCSKLMDPPMLRIFFELVGSDTSSFTASYNACAALANFAVTPRGLWAARDLSRGTIFERMIFRINLWPLNFATNDYQSLRPIIVLLPCEISPASQHWACWALASLTRNFPETYCQMLEQEDGVGKLQSIASDSSARIDTQRLAKLALKHVELYKKRVPEYLWEAELNAVGLQEKGLNV